MNCEQVIELMKSSKSETEWNHNCDKVRSLFNNSYPHYWYEKVIESGLLAQTSANWK